MSLLEDIHVAGVEYVDFAVLQHQQDLVSFDVLAKCNWLALGLWLLLFLVFLFLLLLLLLFLLVFFSLTMVAQ